METFETLSPIDNSVVFKGTYHAENEVADTLERAVAAQREWREVPLSERIALLRLAIDHLSDSRDSIGREISRQIGRPIRYAPGEIDGLVERGETMLRLSIEALSDVRLPDQSGRIRIIKREPIGVVAVLAPWNYPFLTSVNIIVPALVAGNAVVLKHSTQTPLVAKAYVDAFEKAGLPEGVFQNLFLTHAGAAKLIGSPHTNHVAFTGSVPGGHAIARAARETFMSIGLELGGKDPAYVRADADVRFAAEQLSDGAFFNSGQSCCGIERIYVHKSIFEEFVKEITQHAQSLKLGDPLGWETTLGPMASSKGADFVRGQIEGAIADGAKPHMPINKDWGSAYLSPQILTNVTHNMAVMKDESFGPVVGIMAVDNDREAVALMNDSPFGLTASIWTSNSETAEMLGRQIETGTVFLNRCDYLDPELAWTGVKNSGRGTTLSRIGFEHLTRPKSYNFRLNT